jgi:hypothetical protein
MRCQSFEAARLLRADLPQACLFDGAGATGSNAMRIVCKSIAFMAALLLVVTAAEAAQGPGTSLGTASTFLQWMAVLCGIGLATLGVVFSRWDDGTYGDF